MACLFLVRTVLALFAFIFVVASIFVVLLLAGPPVRLLQLRLLSSILGVRAKRNEELVLIEIFDVTIIMLHLPHLLILRVGVRRGVLDDGTVYGLTPRGPLLVEETSHARVHPWPIEPPVVVFVLALPVLALPVLSLPIGALLVLCNLVATLAFILIL